MENITKIFLICRNNRRELMLCVKAILNRTKFPFKIIIVDNGSTKPKMLNYLAKVKKIKEVDVYVNKKNLWVLGLNPALNKFLSFNDKWYVVSDSDIIVPLPEKGKCWLERLVEEIKENVMIGKLGLSLDLGFIANRSQFFETYRREKSYYNDLKIGENYIAPVDTTLAIYRYDYFIMNTPKFFPGHGVLGRPHYYCCRSSKSLSAKHIGWRRYLSDRSTQADDISKAICFTILGAYLDETFLKKLPKKYRLMYRICRPLSRASWGVFVVLLQMNWFFRNTPKKLNKVQSSSNKI